MCARHKPKCALWIRVFFFKPKVEKDNLKDNLVSRWQSWAIVQNRKANGYTVAVSSFVWPLDYFLKWAHQKPMLGENKGTQHDLMLLEKHGQHLLAMDDGDINIAWALGQKHFSKCPVEKPCLWCMSRKWNANNFTVFTVLSLCHKFWRHVDCFFFLIRVLTSGSY